MDAETTQRGGPELLVVRRSGQGWQVGPEETADLTSAMVLADLLAADLGSPAVPPVALPAGPPALSQGDRGPKGAMGSKGAMGTRPTRRRGWP